MHDEHDKAEAGIHPGWHRLNALLKKNALSRRRFLPAAAAAAGTALWPSLLLGGQPRQAAQSLPDQASWQSNNKIKHVVILCQENRSFDHYFGAFAASLGKAGNRPTGFGPHLAYKDSTGQSFPPSRLTQFCNEDPDHGWEGSHAKWNGGKMDGWVAAEDGSTRAIGYFEPADHIYHVQLANAFTLADHYFCSQIGPTLPNRLYLWSGTSGWGHLTPDMTDSSLPFNNPSLRAPPPTLTWPTMGDVLDTAGLPWKCYSVMDGSVPSAIGAFNPLIFFSRIQKSPAKLAKATAQFSEFFTDLRAGTLPAVSWIVTEATVCEHPPAPPDMGQLFAARVVQELMNSSAWESTALFITYDEGGGFFDSVPPTILETVPQTLPDAGEAVGPAFRVPLFIVSPYARRRAIFKEVMDHTSILQFVEQTFTTSATPVHLPTIHPHRRTLNHLAKAFDFTQTPVAPALPTAQQLYSDAKKDVLVLNAKGTVASCATTAPKWLPQLLGV
jgi:phospholipase C